MNKYKNYYEDIPTTVIDTGRNILRYYKNYERLQISNPDWTDRQTGETKRGKTLSINLNAVRETPEALELLQQIIKDIAI